jgi:hypothetical protein
MTWKLKPHGPSTRTAVVIEDMGFHEDSRYPGTGAHYWSAKTDDGTEIVLADPGCKPLTVGEETPVICRTGAPTTHTYPIWIWARNRAHTHFSAPISPRRKLDEPRR